MPTVHEILSDQFHRWEQRGRGWQVFDRPVAPEPSYVPIRYEPPEPTPDDGRRPSFLSSLVQRLSRNLAGTSLPDPMEEPAEEEAAPERLERSELIELQISLPRDCDPSRQVFAQFLRSIEMVCEPVSFEVIAVAPRPVVQFTLATVDEPLVRKQLEAAFPEVSIIPHGDHLSSIWETGEDWEAAVFELGLEREFMLPLAYPKLDPLTAITAAMSGLPENELALFQVLFQPVSHPWAEDMVFSVSHGDGRPLFQNAPELTRAAAEKAGQPLYAVIVRIATRAPAFDRAWAIARELASSLRAFANPRGNELIPLHNDEYPYEEHIEDVLLRQSRRNGMILTLEELTGLAHLPSIEVPRLARELTKTKAAPKSVRTDTGLLLGHNVHAGVTTGVRLSPEQRVRHTHVIGASGTGKSTLLFNLIRQDIENGEGLAVLDPHGDLIDRITGIIPEERIRDVILFDPADEEYAIGFNVLSAHSELEKTLLASDLVSVFQRLSSSWGDQLGSVLQNAVLAFLESSRGGTLADLRRFLIEPDFKREFLTTVRDSEVVYYWTKAFPQLSGNRSIGPVVTRLDALLGKKTIRHLVSQPANRLDFGEITDTGKVLLARLPEGLLGRENSHLLGSLLVARFQQLAMSRQAKQIDSRRDFWIYLDEFANFISPSITEILTGARKYRVGLILAHHELRQLDRDKEVASAVLSNTHTRVVFRVGDDDARKLREGFASFEARDLQNLEIGHAICRVERSDFDFNLDIAFPPEPDPSLAADVRRRVIAASRETYGTRRADVEAMEAAVIETKKEPAKTAVVRPQPPRVVPPPVEVPPALPEPRPVIPPPPEVKPAPVIEPAPATAPVQRRLGRGGELHKSIQERIQGEARVLGFTADIEGELAKHSNEAADLLLRKGDLTIAVEIPLTNTLTHEFGNVKKCLAAGVPRVAVVSPKESQLKSIRSAVIAGLDAEQAARVSFHTPEEFIAELKELARLATEPRQPDVKVIGGYKVRRRVATLTPEERRAREETAIRVTAEAMKRKP